MPIVRDWLDQSMIVVLTKAQAVLDRQPHQVVDVELDRDGSG